MWPEPVERVARELRAAAAEAMIQEFPEGTPTARDAAKAVGCSLPEIVKSIVFVAGGSYVLALVPGDRRADDAAVAGAAGVESVRVATADEVREATGFEPGGVAPFPHRSIARVLIDRTLMQHSRVWIGAGTDRHMAGLSPSELQRVANAETADLLG